MLGNAKSMIGVAALQHRKNPVAAESNATEMRMIRMMMFRNKTISMVNRTRKLVSVIWALINDFHFFNCCWSFRFAKIFDRVATIGIQRR